MQCFLCSVFHVFKIGKWNGLEINVAYVTRLFKTRLGIYGFPLYVKAFLRYKRKTKVSIFHVVRFPLISQKRFHVQRRSIYPQTRLGKAGNIGWFNIQSVPFSMDKN